MRHDLRGAFLRPLAGEWVTARLTTAICIVPL